MGSFVGVSWAFGPMNDSLGIAPLLSYTATFLGLMGFEWILRVCVDEG